MSSKSRSQHSQHLSVRITTSPVLLPMLLDCEEKGRAANKNASRTSGTPLFGSVRFMLVRNIFVPIGNEHDGECRTASMLSQLILPPDNSSPVTEQHPITVENAQQVGTRCTGHAKNRSTKNESTEIYEKSARSSVGNPYQPKGSQSSKKHHRELSREGFRLTPLVRLLSYEKKNENHGTAPDAGEGLSLLHHFPVWLVQTNTQGERKYTSTNINRLELLATTSRGYISYLPYEQVYKQAPVVPLGMLCRGNKGSKKLCQCAHDVWVVVVFSFSLLSACCVCMSEVGSHMPAILARVIYVQQTTHTWNPLVGAQ